MKTSSLTLDQTLYQLLVKEGVTSFTIPELRDRYAETLSGKLFDLPQLRIYVYEQIRKMIRAGWVEPDDERKKRGQLFHLLEQPSHLEIKLVESRFPAEQLESASVTDDQTTCQQLESEKNASSPVNAPSHDIDKLQGMLKEIRVDFLTSVGQTERYRELMEEMPSLRGLVESEFLTVRDSSSRLLGHIRALESTLHKLER